MAKARGIERLSGWIVLLALMAHETHSIETGRVMSVQFLRFIPFFSRVSRPSCFSFFWH